MSGPAIRNETCVGLESSDAKTNIWQSLGYEFRVIFRNWDTVHKNEWFMIYGWPTKKQNQMYTHPAS